MDGVPYSSMDRPATYQIKVQGRFGTNWSEYFGGMEITTEQHESGITVTVLTGVVPDQAALHGLIQKFRDLGLTIIQIQFLNFE